MREGGTAAARGGALAHIVAFVATVTLVITLIAAGFGACCLPISTQLLSQTTSNFAGTSYEPDQLTALAVATRGFTVDDFGRSINGTEGAQTSLNESIVRAAQKASATDSPKHDRWNAAALTVLTETNENTSVNTTALKLAAISDSYALDGDALSHLEDCNVLISTAVPWLWVAAGLSGVLVVALALKRRKRLAGRALTAAPVFLIIALAMLGAWAVMDFNGFFSAFHSVFFPQGNWTFSAESLLICMYPINFWMGMGAVWLVTTVIACILSLIIGRRLRKGVR